MYPAIHLNCGQVRQECSPFSFTFLWITKTPGLHCNKTQYFGFVDRVSPAYIIQGSGSVFPVRFLALTEQSLVQQNNRVHWEFTGSVP